MKKTKSERLRFANEDDLCLLREMLCYNPYNDSENWLVVQKHVVILSSKQFPFRTVTENVEYLLKPRAKEDR